MNNFNVEHLGIDDLTEEELDEFGGDTWVTYLKISYKNKTLLIANDQMEPEDASFNRDLSWVFSALEIAYACGLKDANNE